MTNSIQNFNKINSGTCPHGCAPSACPICSGMGGGSMRVGERPQKAGEMSYHQCAMIGAMMKAREARLEEHEKNLKLHAESILKFEQNMQNLSEKLAEFVLKFSNNFVFKPIVIAINNIILPVINIIKNIPTNLQGVINKISQLKVDIQDKLNAIFGEAKVFLQKKVSEFVSVIRTKFDDLFKIFKRNNKKDDETKIDEDKKLFRLKIFIDKLLKKKDDTENKTGS